MEVCRRALAVWIAIASAGCAAPDDDDVEGRTIVGGELRAVPTPDPPLDRSLAGLRDQLFHNPALGTGANACERWSSLDASQRAVFLTLTDRLFLSMLGEASRVVAEGIVRDPADVDMGLILGLGFPAWRGGLLRWAQTVGLDTIRQKMANYAGLGPRFVPVGFLA